MYYDNKSSFYVKQYGPVIIIFVLSIALIASGVYIYVKSSFSNKIANDNLTEENINVTNQVNDKNNSVSNIQKVDNIISSSNENSTINNLQPLQKSAEGKVQSISDFGSIRINFGDYMVETYLIGIDFSKDTSKFVERLRTDLLNKNVKIAFDKTKYEASNMYSYLFIDNDNLYNSVLLKDGMAMLRVERNNVNLLDVLLKSQQEARSNLLGVWKK